MPKKFSFSRCASSEVCDQCGRRRMRCRIARPNVQCFAHRACSASGYRRNLWLHPPIKLSDGRRTMHHPFASFAGVIATSRTTGRHHPGSTPAPNQSANNVRPGLADPVRPARIPRRAPASKVAVRAPHFQIRAPLMRFWSPTAHSGRAALSRAAGPERSRFGVCCRLPAHADLERPFALAVFRFAEAERRCSQGG